MKQNLSQIQYEQLAREQFCNRLKEIPFVSDIEVFLEKKNAPLGDFKAKVYSEDSDEPLLFVIEVRSNGEKRFVNHFMEIVMRQDDKTHYIFMAPYISEQSARAMKEEKCSYMDLSGNCYILTKRFLLYVSGQDNKFIIHREKKNYLSKSSSAASAIIRTMLNEPERKWQVKTLAQESNTAL